MKIKDYKLFLEGNSDMYIHSTCKQYSIENYTINSDGKVDVDGDVDLRYKRLVILPFKFGKVTGEFNCRSNYLYTLEGSPDWVGGLFSCADNQLTSLNNGPKYVGQYFNCSFNKLKTLEGGPEVVIMDYNCENNELINFKGFPEYYEGTAYFNNNPIDKILSKIPYIKYTKFIYWCNELNVIDDEGNINEEWLEEAHHQIGIM